MPKPPHCSYRLRDLLITCVTLLISACNDDTQQLDLDKTIDPELIEQQAEVKQNNQHIYKFGFDIRSGPAEDARQYTPFLKYLAQQTGYEFKLHFTPQNSNTIEEIGKGASDFAAMGAEGYLKAQQKYGATSLVRGMNKFNKAEYQSLIVVQPDSRITKLSELKNKRFAFGDVDSTQGHLIPRIILKTNNIELSDLASHQYTGSHRNCAEAVISGSADACGMQDTLARELVKQGKLRILHTSDFYPSSGIVASKNVPEDVKQRVTEALINFKPNGEHARSLYQWQKTEMPNGFTRAKDQDYQRLRHWSVNFGFLESDQ